MTLHKDMKLDDLIELLQEKKAQGVQRVLFGYDEGSVTEHVHVIDGSHETMTSGVPLPQHLWSVTLIPHNHKWDLVTYEI